MIDSSLGEDNNKIELRGIHPSSIDSEDIHEAIEGCYAFRKFTLAYLGVGAARGTEVDRLAEDLSIFDFVFNSLHYQMGSEKGQLHAQNKNALSDHYVPPSLSRRIVVILVCLHPALLNANSEAFRVPS